jgi:hypothetical protein
VTLPFVSSLTAARDLADAAARLGVDAFYRVFERTKEGERFTVAYSVYNGTVREHEAPSIPIEHW